LLLVGRRKVELGDWRWARGGEMGEMSWWSKTGRSAPVQLASFQPRQLSSRVPRLPNRQKNIPRLVFPRRSKFQHQTRKRPGAEDGAERRRPARNNDSQIEAIGNMQVKACLTLRPVRCSSGSSDIVKAYDYHIVSNPASVTSTS
jgi:hypothetical protein